jgi:hypothetical protein
MNCKDLHFLQLEDGFWDFLQQIITPFLNFIRKNLYFFKKLICLFQIFIAHNALDVGWIPFKSFLLDWLPCITHPNQCLKAQQQINLVRAV